jgi:hypothetical protein
MLDLALSLVLRAVAVQQAKTAAARAVLYVVASGLTALFLLAVMACLLTALWIYAGQTLGQVAAPAIVAAVLLLLAGATALFLRLQTRRRLESLNAIPELSSPLGALCTLMRDHTEAILVGAVVLGLLGGSNRRRRA